VLLVPPVHVAAMLWVYPEQVATVGVPLHSSGDPAATTVMIRPAAVEHGLEQTATSRRQPVSKLPKALSPHKPVFPSPGTAMLVVAHEPAGKYAHSPAGTPLESTTAQLLPSPLSVHALP
jgi:hypothetical protein